MGENIPEAAAVNVAHVPVVYQVPAEMMHPTELLPVLTFKNPLPSNTPVPVGAGGGLTLVVVGGALPPLGRYLTPVAGQVDLVPSIYCSNYKHVLKIMPDFGGKEKNDIPGSAATNWPVGTLPSTLKWYQISFNSPLLQPMVTGRPFTAVRAA